MTATRSGSVDQPGQPASSSAARLHATDQRCPSSICSLTFGGSGSFPRIGSQLKSVTQPPILE